MASMPFRHVTLLYAREDQNWCDYLLRHFRNDKLELRLVPLAVDDTDYENPPEIEVAVRESHVLVLFTTTNLQNYMEEKEAWFAPMLRKSDPEVSVILKVLLDLTRDEMITFSEEHSYDFEPSNCMEMSIDGSNTTELIAHILAMVETYQEKKAKRDAPPRRLSEAATPVEIVPRSLQKAGEKMALLFKQEVSGKVTVNFSHQKEDVMCDLVNPYCAVFTVPEVSGNRISMQIDIDGVRHSRHKLSSSHHSGHFSSIELLCQSYGVSSKDELDKLLASRFSESLCSDPLAKRIFDTLSDARTFSERSPHQYPSMLHWAAAHGLKDFTSALLSAPGAALASEVSNKDGNDPIDLARKNGFQELSIFIDEYLEAQDMANTWDLYVHSSAVAQDLKDGQTEGGVYETMNALGPMNFASGTGIASSNRAFMDPVPPPLPPARGKRSGSLTPDDPLPSPKDFFAMPSNWVLPSGALGSRSQTELIDIQNEVKNGNFSVKEAEMLFRSWKERYETGNAISFRDRQKGLQAFKKENEKVMDAMRKLNKGKKKKHSVETKQTAIEISDPILKRENFGSGKRVAGAGRGGSTNSNVSCQSLDSGRDSSVSLASRASTSSDDVEYLDPEDAIQMEEPPLRSPKEAGNRGSSKKWTFFRLRSKRDMNSNTFEHAFEGDDENVPSEFVVDVRSHDSVRSSKVNRQSMKDTYLSLLETDEIDFGELAQPPPPVPPRPSSRLPPVPASKPPPLPRMTSANMSGSKAQTLPKAKPQVFTRHGSSSGSNPIVPPRSNSLKK